MGRNRKETGAVAPARAETPQRLFSRRYSTVENAQILLGSKEFVDAIPKSSPDGITRRDRVDRQQQLVARHGAHNQKYRTF
jgi:hypothetical protein